MSDISSIKVPEVETPYTVKDPNAVHLSGSNVAAADFMLNLQNNAGGAIKWPSGDMTDLKRGWTAADGFTGAGIGADIPSIAAMIDAKMSTASPVDVVADGNMHAVTSNAVYDEVNSIKERLVKTIPANTYASYGAALTALKAIYDQLTATEKRNAYIVTTGLNIFRNYSGDGRFVDVSFAVATSRVWLYCIYLPSNNLYHISITGTAGVVVTDKTSNAQTGSIDLYTRSR